MRKQKLRDLLEDRVEMDVEGMDLPYPNAPQPRLQTSGGLVSFVLEHRGAWFASTTLAEPLGKDFVKQIHTLAQPIDGSIVINLQNRWIQP